jgi:phosphoserine phosphatase RsbU/P
MHRIRCSEIWGGIRNADLDACTSGLTASLYSSACDGGRGGDVYYISLCAWDSLTRIAVADVMGHGEKVSRTSQWLYESLAEQMNSTDGAAVLAETNRRAEQYGFRALSTAAVVSYYSADGQFRFCYAGHPPAFVFRRAENVWRPAELDAAEGLANTPLGVSVEALYDQQRLPLSSGDRIFVYTDGLLEAPAPSGELFGADRLQSALNDAARLPLAALKESLLAALRSHTGGPLDHDDVTLVAVEVN